MRSICEKTLALKKAHEGGSIYQVGVTVAAALLIDWAAPSALIAVISVGHAFYRCCRRPGFPVSSSETAGNIKKRLAKIQVSYKVDFAPQSVKQQLGSPFWLPHATSYSDVRTHAQQAKIDAAASRGTLTC